MAKALERGPVSALDRFKRATAVAVPRIIALSAGEPGAGKTQFWLTAPGPIVILSFDKGLEGVVEKFAGDKEVRVAEYDWEPTDDTFDQAQAILLRDQFVADYYFACEHARTVVIDKSSDFWSLVRYSEFGDKTGAQLNYDALNQRMRKYVNHPKKLTINAGFVESLKDEYVTVMKANGKKGGESTGNRKLAGFKELDGLVNVVMYHEFDEAAKVFKTSVPSKARGIGSEEVMGRTFENLDFTTLGMLLFPDSDTPDWK